MEGPNGSVDGDSWEPSACYPRRTFYPLSDGPSTRDHRITSADSRPCAARRPCSQAGLCACTRRLVSDQPEPTVAGLRYALGGDRPSQTARHAGSRPRATGGGYTANGGRVVFQGLLRRAWRPGLVGSHLSYTRPVGCQREAAVKVHGVFPSDRGYPASSRGVQFRRARTGDSGEVVTPFVQVGTYPTRNFATLGPL